MGAEQAEVSTQVWVTTGEIKGAGGCKYRGSSGGRRRGGGLCGVTADHSALGPKVFYLLTGASLP